MRTLPAIGLISSGFFATSVAMATPAQYCHLPHQHQYQKHQQSHTSHYKRGYQVNVNLHKLQRRIQHGVNNGQLTHEEARILRQKMHHLRSALSRVNADGYVSKQEKQRVEHKAHRLSSLIHQKKHNHITRHTQHHGYGKGVVYHFHL